MELIGIQAAPGEENAAIRLHLNDNVAIARLSLPEGQRVRFGDSTVTLRAPVPAGHKLALESIPARDPIRRYGEVIGRANRLIEAGEQIGRASCRETV